MLSDVRRQAIIKKLRECGSVTNAQLAAEYGVSQDTIRRDLRILVDDGLVTRTHGGVVWSDARELVFGVNRDPFLRAKRAIAHKALDFVRPGETIAIDMGRTTLQMARALLNTTRGRPLTVFTSDLRIGMVLSRARGITVLITGGIIGRRNYISGPFTIEMLGSLQIDTLFLSASGISTTSGITEPLPDVADIKRTMVGNSKRIILLADYSKFGHRYKEAVVPLEKIDALITDQMCPPDIQSEMVKLGVSIVIAQKV